MTEKKRPSGKTRAGGNAGDPSTTPRCGAVPLPVPGRIEKIQPNKNRKIQVARTGRRKLFNRAAQKVFLEWFAATCNVKWSAEMAGFNYKTVLRHRMTDAVFAEGWDRAVRQAYARLEAQQLETKRKEAPIGIEGDWDAPEMDAVDPQLAIQLLREHKREVVGPRPAFGEPRKQGRRPTVASNAEVKAALLKALKAFEGRVKAGKGKGDECEDDANNSSRHSRESGNPDSAVDAGMEEKKLDPRVRGDDGEGEAGEELE